MDFVHQQHDNFLQAPLHISFLRDPPAFIGSFGWGAWKIRFRVVPFWQKEQIFPIESWPRAPPAWPCEGGLVIHEVGKYVETDYDPLWISVSWFSRPLNGLTKQQYCDYNCNQESPSTHGLWMESECSDSLNCLNNDGLENPIASLEVWA